jgi:hypothetical protein
MVKFKARNKAGKTQIGIGLSDINFRRLKADEPILFNADIFELKPGEHFEIFIFAYGSEQEAMEKCERMGFEMPDDPDRIHIDPKLAG